MSYELLANISGVGVIVGFGLMVLAIAMSFWNTLR